MTTRVLLTVDTELTWRHYARGASWQENFAGAYEAAGVGVPYQLALLREHGLKACFFVDPMPALVYGIEPVRRMVTPILDAGQEVQLHLHSFWQSVAEGVTEGANFELTCFDADDQADLLAEARDLLVEAGAPPPIAFRAGSYAADAATIEGLRAIGIRYDSSHNGSEHPWPSALPLDPNLIAPVDLGGVIEVPVGQIEDRNERLRHLQLTALSFGELRAALDHADRHSHPVTALVSHSFELATRDGSRANPVLKRRFERLCGFLADHRDRLPTVHFTDLDGVDLTGEAAPLPAAPVRRARRMAEQLWSNAVYERRL